MRMEIEIARNYYEEKIKLISSDNNNMFFCAQELLDSLSRLTEDAKNPIINRMIEELKKIK